MHVNSPSENDALSSACSQPRFKAPLQTGLYKWNGSPADSKISQSGLAGLVKWHGTREKITRESNPGCYNVQTIPNKFRLV